MVNIDTVYQRVLVLANKEQRGYITPQEFNLLANQAQMDIFEQYFYDLNQFMRAPGNNTNYADITQLIEEKINIFEEDVEISGTAVQSANEQDIVVFNLNASIPNLYRVDQVRVYRNGAWRIAEKVTKKQIRLMKGGLLTMPTRHRPAYVMRGNNSLIDFYHDADFITVDYIRKPLNAKWAWQIINGNQLYDESNSVNFELHPSEETKLVIKILALAGITIKDTSVYQIATAEDNKNIQQEKQ